MSNYENIVSVFSLVRTAFLSLCKIVDGENSPDNYEALKTSIGAITENPGMRNFVPDQLKIKQMCKNAVKKLPFVIMYVPDRYKTQEMYDKVILENGGMLKFSPGCYKNKKI